MCPDIAGLGNQAAFSAKRLSYKKERRHVKEDFLS